MSDCPSFDQALFDEYIANASSVDVDLSLLTCTETDGIRGGARATRIVKAIIYVLIAYLGASALLSGDMDGVVRGLRMVKNGECTTIGSVFMSWSGFGNPVCEQYRRMLALLPQLITNPRLIYACINTRAARLIVLPTCIDLVARILTGDGDRKANITELSRITGMTVASLALTGLTAGRRKVTSKRKSNRRRRESKHRSYRRRYN